eukprot:4092989-Pleurochrysis_carterae.AAC.3
MCGAPEAAPDCRISIVLRVIQAFLLASASLLLGCARSSTPRSAAASAFAPPCAFSSHADARRALCRSSGGRRDGSWAARRRHGSSASVWRRAGRGGEASEEAAEGVAPDRRAQGEAVARGGARADAGGQDREGGRVARRARRARRRDDDCRSLSARHGAHARRLELGHRAAAMHCLSRAARPTA